jgi:hypothetical protein
MTNNRNSTIASWEKSRLPAAWGCSTLAAWSTRAEGEEMTKTPGEFEPPKPMTKAERDARKAFRQVEAEKAMSEYEIAQKAFSKKSQG